MFQYFWRQYEDFFPFDTENDAKLQKIANLASQLRKNRVPW